MNKYKQELVDKLNKANEILIKMNKSISFVAVGGFYFIMRGNVPRATYDIDSLIPIDKAIELALNPVIDINSMVLVFEQQFGTWQDDVQEKPLFELSNIKIFCLSDEKMIASRCFTSRREEDVIESLKTLKLDKDKFENAVQNIYDYSVLLKDFYDNEYLLKEIYKQGGWDYEKSNTKKLHERSIERVFPGRTKV